MSVGTATRNSAFFTLPFNFKVFSKSSGKVVSEKNTIAIINKTQIYAYGDDAYAMYEKAPESINVTFPVST